ncbi:hypothetical protein NUM3379_00890 [Kineococcus sp. NUM-3379]
MTRVVHRRRLQASGYVEDSLGTAGPATLLIMLWDRLVLDLKRAEEALTSENREVAHINLMHAQDIVHELNATLDVTVWEGGAGLRALYVWLITELTQCNVQGDADRTRGVRETIVEPLADAWRQAALQQLNEGAGATVAEGS